MISTVSLSFDLTYTDPVTGALQPRGIVTDSTDYTGLGINLASSFAKGLGQITFNGDIIVPFGDNTNPNINLETWNYVTQGVPNFTFNLPLDVNGNVANGIYTLEYSLRLNPTFDVLAVPLPTVFVVDTPYSWLLDFLQVGDDLLLTGGNPAQHVTFASAVFNDPNVNITTSNSILSAYTNFSFDLSHIQSTTSYTYSGCTQVAAKIDFVYDCEYETNGTFSVSNATELNGQTIVGLTAIINYPAWTSLTPTFNSQIITTTLPYSNNVLATGTYGVTLYETISQTQNDGLVIQYTASTIQEFNVSCVGSLCNLIPCIESLRNAHAIELQRNRISKYQVYVDNVLLYYTEAQNYRNCGNWDKYRETLGLLEAQLDASGCDCGCCDPDNYVWVNNNAASTIDTLINAIQFKLKSGVPDGNDDITKGVLPGAIWEDVSTLPAQKGKLYICTQNTPAGNANWSVYYDPNATIAASSISATPGSNLTSTTVQGQLTQADTLFSSVSNLNGDNGITRVVDDFVLGGSLTGNTTIDTASYNLKVSTSINVTPLLVESSAGPAAIQITKSTAIPSSLANNTQRVIVSSPSGLNGLGSYSSVYLSDVTGAQQLASKVTTEWTDSTIKDSEMQFATTFGGVNSPKLVIEADGTIKFVNYNGPFNIDPLPAYSLGVNSNGEVVQTVVSVNSNIFAGSISGTGSGAVLVPYANNTGETFTLSNPSTGNYRITASGPVFASNTVVFFQSSTSLILQVIQVSGLNTIDIYAYTPGGIATNSVDGAMIKIEVYL